MTLRSTKVHPTQTRNGQVQFYGNSDPILLKVVSFVQRIVHPPSNTVDAIERRDVVADKSLLPAARKISHGAAEPLKTDDGLSMG